MLTNRARSCARFFFAFRLDREERAPEHTYFSIDGICGFKFDSERQTKNLCAEPTQIGPSSFPDAQSVLSSSGPGRAVEFSPDFSRAIGKPVQYVKICSLYGAGFYY
ncbi:MAG: porin, partial [Proteobacteria bacterium]|nr:porin [Pseudomonadota bacterium]